MYTYFENKDPPAVIHKNNGINQNGIRENGRLKSKKFMLHFQNGNSS